MNGHVTLLVLISIEYHVISLLYFLVFVPSEM